MIIIISAHLQRLFLIQSFNHYHQAGHDYTACIKYVLIIIAKPELMTTPKNQPTAYNI